MLQWILEIVEHSVAHSQKIVDIEAVITSSKIVQFQSLKSLLSYLDVFA